MSHDVVVIGGGQAGRAIGHHLARQRCDFTISEADEARRRASRIGSGCHLGVAA